jgi:hypothetical protein
LKEIIANEDASAFVCINETYEVMGSFAKKSTLQAQLQEQAVDGTLEDVEIAHVDK